MEKDKKQDEEQEKHRKQEQDKEKDSGKAAVEKPRNKLKSVEYGLGFSAPRLPAVKGCPGKAAAEKPSRNKESH